MQSDIDPLFSEERYRKGYLHGYIQAVWTIHEMLVQGEETSTILDKCTKFASTSLKKWYDSNQGDIEIPPRTNRSNTRRFGVRSARHQLACIPPTPPQWRLGRYVRRR